MPGLSLGAWHMFFFGVLVFWVVSDTIHVGWVAGYLVLVAGTLAARWDPGTVFAAVTALSILAVHRFFDLRQTLNSRVLQYLGRISYSLYLIHPTVGTRSIRVMKRVLGPDPGPLAELAMFSVATVLSLVAAHALWRLLEKPSQLLSKRIKLAGRPEPSVQLSS